MLLKMCPSKFETPIWVWVNKLKTFKWAKTFLEFPGRMLALRSSSSRMSSSKRRQLPTSSHSRRTTSSRSQTSAKRPTFVANTLATGATTSTGSAARRKKKASSSKPRCAMSECKKKLNLTNTFSCRYQLLLSYTVFIIDNNIAYF